MDAILDRADVCFGVISSSVRTAGDDYTFGGDAISLCERFANGTHSSEELKSSVQLMLGMALGVKRRAINIFETFCQVQAELVKVCNGKIDWRSRLTSCRYSG